MRNDCGTATENLAMVQSGQLSAAGVMSPIVAAIARHEPSVQAWEYIDLENVMRQATALDTRQREGHPLGPLHGVAIAIKDIIATADMPTGWGTPIHQGTMRGYDAAVVQQLRAAGAIIMGKTVTTEYAAARPGKTGNPHNLNHTPGGSSSGSAAAVTAGMVPVALGSQTLGSILRPAAYCGVLGFKPSFGTISRHGVMPVCRDLDHLGLFARTVSDLQRVSAVLAVPDPRDPDCGGSAALQSWTERPVDSAPPRLALWTTPFWPQIDPNTQQHFLNCAALLEQSGAAIAPIQLSADFAECYDDAQTLMSVGLAVNHGGDYDRHGDQLSPKLRDWIERGRQTTAIAYGRARQRTVDYSVALSTIFASYDAILMPVTTGPAPATRDDTGSPVFCALATLCGLPAISIPAGTADNGLPLAVQLMGKKYGDRNLLQIADWLHLRLSETPVDYTLLRL